MSGRHRLRFAAPRGLRPLTVVALCSVVAVLAVLATETTHPYNGGGGGTSSAAIDPGDGSDSDSSGPPNDGTDDSTQDPDVDATDATTAPPTPGATTGQPAPQPAPIAPAIPDNPQPVPAPAPNPPGSPSTSPTPPPGPVYIEAESSANTLTNTRIYSCTPCSSGKKVGNVGDVGSTTGTMQFNNIRWGSGGQVLLVISYVNGDLTSRTARFSLNGGGTTTLTFSPTGNWNTVRTLSLRVTLASGSNTIKFTNPTKPAPDFDMITVRAP